MKQAIAKVAADERKKAAALPALPEALVKRGIRLRREGAGDRPFLRRLYATQRAPELLLARWSESEKTRFLDEQFRLQMLHFEGEKRAFRFMIECAAPAPALALAPEPEPEPLGRLYVDCSANVWRLLEIALLPAMQGRGIGSALLGWLHVAGSEAGAEAITLHVTIGNVRAEALYRRLGYVEAPSDWTTHKKMRCPLRG